MKTFSFTPEFEMYQEIYHISSDSPKGLIVNITYNVKRRDITYTVAFTHEVYENYAQDELTTNKRF